MGLIVFLEHTHAVDPAKGDEETGRCACDGEPGLCAAVGKDLGIHQWIPGWLLGDFSILRWVGGAVVTIDGDVSFGLLWVYKGGWRQRIGFGHDLMMRNRD